MTTYDQNDTACDPVGNNHSDWYKRRTDPTHTRFAEYDNAENRRAADLVKVHANTPLRVFLDSLGREVVSVAHNKFVYSNGVTTGDEKYVTFTKLDAEGKPLWIRDARGNLVMQYISPPKANNDPNDDLPYRDLETYLQRSLLRHRRESALPAQHGCGRPLDAQRRRRQTDVCVG
jgi:hypothetical protein